jgi:hypothetical protein
MYKYYLQFCVKDYNNNNNNNNFINTTLSCY